MRKNGLSITITTITTITLETLYSKMNEGK